MCQTLTGPEDSFLTNDNSNLCFKPCMDLWTHATCSIVQALILDQYNHNELNMLGLQQKSPNIFLQRATQWLSPWVSILLLDKQINPRFYFLFTGSSFLSFNNPGVSTKIALQILLIWSNLQPNAGSVPIVRQSAAFGGESLSSSNIFLSQSSVESRSAIFIPCTWYEFFL